MPHGLEHVLRACRLKLSPSGLYYVPDTGSHDSYLSHIASWPLTESPEVFGLHDNATITMDLQKTQALLDALQLTQPREGAAAAGGAGKTVEDVIFEAATDFLDRLPADFDLEAAQRKWVLHPALPCPALMCA